MAKKGHVPERTCIVCKEKKPKKELIRFCLKDGKIIMDKEQNKGARGAYFCLKCMAKLKNKKVLEKLKRALKIKNNKDIKLEF